MTKNLDKNIDQNSNKNLDKNIDISKLNAAVDILIESDIEVRCR